MSTQLVQTSSINQTTEKLPEGLQVAACVGIFNEASLAAIPRLDWSYRGSCETEVARHTSSLRSRKW